MESTGQNKELRRQAASVLKCFLCRGSVRVEVEGFQCEACGTSFPVKNGLIEYHREGLGGYGACFKEGAENYESDFRLDETWSRWITARIKSVVGPHLRVPAPFMLELACGTGVHTRGLLFNAVAEQILATDISPEMLAQAVRSIRSPNVLFLIQDAHNLDIRDDSMDLVSGGSALHHFLQLEQCLGEIRRVLKTGGVAVFVEPFYPGTRMLAFLLESITAWIKATGAHDASELGRLEAAIRSYVHNLEFRYENRSVPESLKALDDKHLFVRSDFRATAARSGFAEVHFHSLYDMEPQDRKNVMKDVAMDIMRNLQVEAGATSLSLDLEAIPFLRSFSEFYEQHFLSDYSPQELIVLVK